MIDVRPFEQLGGAHHGWLNARHHFSFAEYYDAERMNWGRLRVWNDDEIAPHSGFPPHPHRDMEIITYVREGAISHEDNLGNKGRTEAGDVQVMSAGTGIAHSEYNLEDETTKIFQIWIQPNQAGLPPSWGAKPFPKATAPEPSSPWPAVTRKMSTPCASVPTRAWWLPRSRRERAPNTPCNRVARPIWWARLVLSVSMA